MNPRPSGIASLLARTFGWRTSIGALGLFGSFAAWDEPLAGTTAAMLLLLARGLRTAARADEERRALMLEIDYLDASLREAQRDNAAHTAEFARSQEEAAQAVHAAAHDEHVDTLRLARRRIVPCVQALCERLDTDAGYANFGVGALRCAAETLALVAQDTLDDIPPADRDIVFDEDAVDLRELIDGVALLVAPVAARKPSRLQACIDRSVAACVLADRARLGQVVHNLLAYAIETAGAGVVTLATRAESLNAGAQRIVIGINGAASTSNDTHSRAPRLRGHQAIAEPADVREHPDLMLARVIARKMGGDITILESKSVGVCVALHAPFTIERHDWPVPEHERRFAVVDIEAYEDRVAICELLKKLGITTLPSDAHPPVRIDFRFAEAGQPPSPHGERRIIVVTRDALPGGMHERGGVIELSLNPLSWTALRRICGARGDAPAVRAVSVQAPARPSSGQPTILVTDDNEVNRKVLARQLDVLGYRCLVASSGDEALDVLSREAVDLLVTDLQMPGMSGVELARHVRATSGGSGSAVPIILLSANADAKLTRTERALFGATLVKTAGLSALDAALRRLLPATSRHRAARLERYDYTALDSLAEQGVDVGGLLRDWQQSMENDLVHLEERRASGDEPGVRRVLHKLAGAVGVVGNRGLVSALQRASDAQEPVDSVLIDGLVERMKAQMTELDGHGAQRRSGP
ncbi:response regulator [Paraburkholderia hospita]|uniref:Response regulator n=1 Tax=Paraburkholderia hospita TaxID=169430 RepID=A0AAN1JG78_9BURK|nr:hybrid sensor histidine kinase/response regulator [Paraburkholderia hospita]AUT72753.1 response regulator [Paraburkholderia hospita]EIN01567.1 response regulator receiver protein [Paraburkholderia hospita]OUL81611.1 response regulator [Paraburkholderia hospita]OUL82964.1 response regulator [Paraburkholderia hospita]SEI25088.1 DNA-binding response regulator, OmpR family, contains REC and winged-helix (wHTH) domain [Paraburkholderia hospita]